MLCAVLASSLLLVDAAGSHRPLSLLLLNGPSNDGGSDTRWTTTMHATDSSNTHACSPQTQPHPPPAITGPPLQRPQAAADDQRWSERMLERWRMEERIGRMRIWTPPTTLLRRWILLLAPRSRRIFSFPSAVRPLLRVRCCVCCCPDAPVPDCWAPQAYRDSPRVSRVPHEDLRAELRDCTIAILVLPRSTQEGQEGKRRDRRDARGQKQYTHERTRITTKQRRR